MSDRTLEQALTGPFDADHPPPLDFEAWAEISAEILERNAEERQAIFDRRELDGDLWDACNVFWIEEIARQIARSNMKLASRYGGMCAAELQKRAPQSGDAVPFPTADATAFLRALPDATALPFIAGSLSTPVPADVTHADAGATQEAPVVDAPEPPLPFRR